MNNSTDSSLENTVKDMTGAEVDYVWKKMEDNLPYISAQARTPAMDMIKELRVIAKKKHEEESVSGR